jgi:hypothetical protein
MNVIDLLTRCDLYQRDLKDWDRKPNTNKTWLNLHPFIQEAYLRRLASGTMTAGQGGYTSCNRFASFQANNATDNNVSDDDTAETIAITINSHMANLLAQTAAFLEANVTQINASLQQLANNNAQLHQQQQSLMQQTALLTTNAAMTQNNAYVPPPAQIYAPPPLYTVFNSNPTILLEGVDEAVDIVAADVPVANAAVEIAAPQCLRLSHTPA